MLDSMTGAPIPMELVEQLAATCVEDVKEVLDFDLDFTIETLPVLDHFCECARSGPSWPEQAEGLALMIGAYFGEVIRKQHPCRWYLSAEGGHAWRLEFEAYFLCFNPVGAALELLLEGDALGWNASYLTWDDATEALQTRLSKLPPVSEEDFYKLTVRHEVLETVTDFLASWTAKDPPKVFDAEFYEQQVAAQPEPEIIVKIG